MIARSRRNTRPRDALGRPLPYGSPGVDAPGEGVVRSPQDTLAQAQRLLAAGRPFHAHEVLEDAWKSGPPEERELWQGLAQLAVGVTHAARGNSVGAARLIERGTVNLAVYAPLSPHGLDIAALAAWARAATARIDAAGPGAEVVLPPPPLA